MRYFKYKNTTKTEKQAWKEHYKSLDEYEKTVVRKGKFWRKISNIVTTIVFVLCIVIGFYLIKLIPQPNDLLGKIFVFIGKAIIGLIMIIVSAVLTFLLTAPLWRKVDSFHWPTMKKEIFSKACSHLREYYELREPYIVTKCFDAADKKFKNHDVCLFVINDELRITTDLLRGFLYGERDLGCYAFKMNEITISKIEAENHLIAELKAGDAYFLLGYRAKGFIESNFIVKYT